MAINVLDQNTLKELLHYNPDNGVFIWNINKGSVKAGSVAGSFHKSQGYIRIVINQIIYQAHRLVFLYMKGMFPNDEVDHINHDRVDNRWCNLREASRKENCMNMSLTPRNTSGCIGVTLDKRSGKWKAQIVTGGEYHYLGVFTDLDDAINARKSAELKFKFHKKHGEQIGC